MKQRRVLLADSDPNMLEGISGLLETMFTSIVMAADEESLLEAAEKFKPDLAVVDLSMPVSGEINVVRRLKDCHPALKLITLSVHDEWAVVKKTLAAGASGFVLKWSAVTDLIPAIREVLQDRTYVSPAVTPPSSTPTDLAGPRNLFTENQ